MGGGRERGARGRSGSSDKRYNRFSDANKPSHNKSFSGHNTAFLANSSPKNFLLPQKSNSFGIYYL